MEFGAEFEDDFFEEPKVKKIQRATEYQPKIYIPLWYMDPELKVEDGCLLNTIKHQADFYYFSHDYPKAVEAYEQCLELVSPANATSKREFMENISRCLLHMDEAEKALTWSLKLHACSINPDQKVVSMNLLATVCHKLGKYKEELEALHCCIDAHKCCPDFWMRLGHCYAGLFKINLPGCSIKKPQTESDQESCCAFNSKIPSSCSTANVETSQSLNEDTSQCAVASTSSSSTPCTKVETDMNCESADVPLDSETEKCEICVLGIQIVSTCLIQTRILIDTGGRNLLSVERDKRTKDMIASSLRHMEVNQAFIDEASKVLGPEFLAGLQDSTGDYLPEKTTSKEVEKKKI